MAVLPTAAALISASLKNIEQKANLVAIRDFLADLFGTDSSNKAAARAALGVPALTSFSAQKGATGYEINSVTGVMRQWGLAVTSSSGTVVVTFPLSFPSKQLHNKVSLLGTQANSPFIVSSDQGSAAQLTIFACGTNGAGAAVYVKWEAIGE